MSAWVALGVGLLFLFWLGCVMNTGTAECLLGALSAIVAAGATFAFGRAARIRFKLSWSMLTQLIRMPWQCVRGTWEVFAALWAHLFRKHGADNALAVVHCTANARTARDTARRAALEILPSSTPNFVVIGAIREKKLLAFHKVRRGKVGPIVHHLGAAPFDPSGRPEFRP